MTLETWHIAAACLGLALVVHSLGLLTWRGTFAAGVIAFFIWSTRGFAWIAVLTLFFVVSAAATKWKYKRKERAGTAEARKGRRSIENVLGSSYAPLLFVVFAHPVGFLASVSAALSDNLASEIGSLSKNVRLITNLKRVPVGTDGGISLLGEVASFVGAGLVAATASILGIEDPVQIGIIWACGFLGSQFDSVLGATLERKGILGKTDVNIAATLFAGLLAAALVYVGADLYLAASLGA